MFYAKGADVGHCPATFDNGRMFAAIIENGAKKTTQDTMNAALLRKLRRASYAKADHKREKPWPVDAGHRLKKH